MKKLGYMSFDMVLPILVTEYPNITPKELYDIVKHKMSKDDFKTALEWNFGWGNILRSFTRGEDKHKPKMILYSRGMELLHRDYIHRIIEDLAEGTLNAAKEKTVTLTIKTKDIHTDRLIKVINGLGYAKVIQDE